MLQALSSLLQRSNVLTSTTHELFAHLLKSCATKSHTISGKSLHAHVIKQGHGSCLLVSKALLNMYAKCQALEDCNQLFDEIPVHDTVTWNILISGFSCSKYHDHDAVRLFNVLLGSRDTRPSSVTLAIVLPLTTRLSSYYTGKSMHGYAIKAGIESRTLVGNALVSMYANSGLVFDAYDVFCGIDDKDVVSYNAMIAGFVANKLLEDAFLVFRGMIERPLVPPNYATIVSVVPICAAGGDMFAYKFGKEIHCYVFRRSEFDGDIMVANALLSFYLRLGRVREAETLFGSMKVRDLVSWNSVIAGYASNGEWCKALEAFREFIHTRMMRPDSVSIMSILPVCSELCDLRTGKEIHGYVVRNRTLHENTSVGNALTNLYAKCGCTEAASNSFSLIVRKDVISWNTLLDALAINKLENEFLHTLSAMFMDKVKPDDVTILTVVQFCAAFSRTRNLKEAHAFSLRSEILLNDREPTLGNALLDAYAKCGNMDSASKMFGNLSETRNVVTCNSMISGYLNSGSYHNAHTIFQTMPMKDLTSWNLIVRGYVLNERPNEALSLFHQLQHHVKLDPMTIISILPICAQTASIQWLTQLHGYIVRHCFEDSHLKAAILDMYSRCGSVNNAYTIYKSTPLRDLVIFTAMIGGFAMHGMGKEAISIFIHMLHHGIEPDDVVITSVLSACRHAGLINEGLAIFHSLDKTHSHIKPSMQHYACVVDLLSRGGQIKEAFEFISRMPIPANGNVWGALLGACKAHHVVDMGYTIADRVLKSECNDIGNLVVLSNLYAADAKWDGVSQMRRLMKAREVKKPAGCSWIEVGGVSNVFMAGDFSHPNRNAIYSILIRLDKQIKEMYQ